MLLQLGVFLTPNLHFFGQRFHTTFVGIRRDEAPVLVLRIIEIYRGGLGEGLFFREPHLWLKYAIAFLDFSHLWLKFKFKI